MGAARSMLYRPLHRPEWQPDEHKETRVARGRPALVIVSAPRVRPTKGRRKGEEKEGEQKLGCDARLSPPFHPLQLPSQEPA